MSDQIISTLPLKPSWTINPCVSKCVLNVNPDNSVKSYFTFCRIFTFNTRTKVTPNWEKTPVFHLDDICIMKLNLSTRPPTNWQSIKICNFALALYLTAYKRDKTGEKCFGLTEIIWSIWAMFSIYLTACIACFRRHLNI